MPRKRFQVLRWLAIFPLAISITVSAETEQCVQGQPALHYEYGAKLYKLLEGYGEDDILEASGVVVVRGEFYVVFDNATTIGRFDPSMPFNSNNNQMLGNNDGTKGYEGISYDPERDLFHVVIEADKKNGCFKGKVVSYEEGPNDGSTSWLDYRFQTKNKGFEGLVHALVDGKKYLLALCEGNDCEAGTISRVSGAGRVKVFRWKNDKWAYTASVRLPDSLCFKDFAGMDLRGSELAIVSQESSALWVGELDMEKWRVKGPGKIFSFPKKNGNKIYCNVEGVAWVGDTRLVTVTDKMKSDQAETCADGDQSIQVFSLPNRAKTGH